MTSGLPDRPFRNSIAPITGLNSLCFKASASVLKTGRSPRRNTLHLGAGRGRSARVCSPGGGGRLPGLPFRPPAPFPSGHGPKRIARPACRGTWHRPRAHWRRDGDAIVGNVGIGAKLGYTAYRDAVNSASRPWRRRMVCNRRCATSRSWLEDAAGSRLVRAPEPSPCQACEKSAACELVHTSSKPGVRCLARSGLRRDVCPGRVPWSNGQSSDASRRNPPGSSLQRSYG
jgi:hypothetical protein